MRTPALVFGLGALLAGDRAAAAQARPSFAGEWTLAPQAPPPHVVLAKAGTATAAPPDLRVTQDGAWLVVRRGDITARYALDGSETGNAIRVRGALVPRASQARWEGDRLVVTSRLEVAGRPWVETRTMWRDAAGALMIESRTTAGGATTTARFRFTKRQDVLL